MDPVALSLLQRYPLPLGSGTANNYNRTASEIDDQDQWDVRLDHKLPSNRDSLFGRLSYFRDGFIPVTPLPEGSGVTTGTLGPQDTTAWSFASNYQHTFSSNLLNEVRVGDTRRTVARTAAQLASSAGGALSIPGIPSTAKFPEHAADVPDRRLPAARLAGEHGIELSHQRVGGGRLADLVEGPAHDQDGARLAMGASGRGPAAVADRIVHLQRARQRSARHGRTPARRSPVSCSARSSSSRSICSRSRFRSARAFRSTSSRMTGRCRTG